MFDGQRLKVLREAQGKTQEEFAQLLGVTSQQIWRWEAGKNDSTGAMIAQIARILGVSADYLLGLSDEPIPTKLPSDLNAAEYRVIQAMRANDLSGLLNTIVEWDKTARRNSPETNVAKAGEWAVLGTGGKEEIVERHGHRVIRRTKGRINE